MKKRNVIKKYREYEEIMALRHYKRVGPFCIYYKGNEFGYLRIGILVGKKNGNSVTRNKIKRQVRSLIDMENQYALPLDCVLAISKSYDTEKFAENETSIGQLFDAIQGEVHG
jgi:ribonuclease P protein component